MCCATGPQMGRLWWSFYLWFQRHRSLNMLSKRVHMQDVRPFLLAVPAIQLRGQDQAQGHLVRDMYWGQGMFDFHTYIAYQHVRQACMCPCDQVNFPCFCCRPPFGNDVVALSLQSARMPQTLVSAALLEASATTTATASGNASPRAG